MAKSKKSLRRPLSPTEKANKSFNPSVLPRANISEIELIKGKNNEMDVWFIFRNDIRVGKGLIKKGKVNDKLLPLITVELNAKSKGQGIGRLVFNKISEISDFDKVYALVRKSNTASINALEKAGFLEKEITRSGQILYEWSRKTE